MATTGTVDVNLSHFGDTINHATTLVDFVLEGVKEQGSLIGLAIGLVIAIGLLFALIFLVLSVVPKLLSKMKGIR